MPDRVSMVKTQSHGIQKRAEYESQKDNKNVLNNHAMPLRQVFS